MVQCKCRRIWHTILLLPYLLHVALAHVQLGGYQLGDRVTMECRGSDGEWGSGPMCQERGEEMHFLFGIDAFQTCGWKIQDEVHYKHVLSIMNREAMVPQTNSQKHAFYLPFSIPLWGVVEKDHFHLDNHLNVVFHGSVQGVIMGVSAYPVRDHMQFGSVGTVISLHGPVKWFKGHSFLSFSAHGDDSGEFTDAFNWVWVLGGCVMSVVGSSLGFLGFYRLYLKQRIIKTLLKQE